MTTPYNPASGPPGGPYGIPQALPSPRASGGSMPGGGSRHGDPPRGSLRGGSGADGFDGLDEIHTGPAEEGFALGHATGYRVWTLSDDATLQGMNGYAWQPGTNVATCRAGHTKIPFVQSDLPGNEAQIRREIMHMTEIRNSLAIRAAEIREQGTTMRLDPEGDPIARLPADMPSLQFGDQIEWVRTHLVPSRFIMETRPEAEAEAARLDEAAREATARIEQLRAQTANRRCGCGFWAYWALENSPVYDGGRRPVVGAVAGTGRVIIGERGFRCAKARLLGLYLAFDLVGADGQPDALAKTAVEAILAEQYGVPVFATRELLYATFPPSRGSAPRTERPSPGDQARWAQRHNAGGAAIPPPLAPAPGPALTPGQAAVQDFLTGKTNSIESGPPAGQAADAFQRAADAAMKARGHQWGWSGRVFGS